MFYWLGECVKIKGMYFKYKINFVLLYIDFMNSIGKVMSFEKCVEKLISWLIGLKLLNFVVVYFEELDKICYYKGWLDLFFII